MRLAAAIPALLAAGALSAQTGRITGRVTEAETGQPVSDAQVRISGTQQGTLTRDDGTYRLSVSPGRYVLRASRIGYGTRTDTVEVGADQTVTRDFALPRSVVNLDAVTTTGTRASDRTVLESPVPVDVLTAEDIRATGQTETSRIIQQLAPSVNFPRPAITDGTDHQRPVTLRGLGPDQALVLVNGKRQHPTALVHVNGSVGRGSASVDLNAIPANAIERIEILRDGAAAQYGSDAIAGVVNIILKSGPEATLTTTAGQYFSGPEWVQGDGYRDGEQLQIQGDYGRSVLGDGFVHLSAQYRNRDWTNRARVDRTNTCVFSNGERIPNCQDLPGDVNIYDRRFVQSWQGEPHVKEWSLFLNSELPAGASGVRAYGFGGFSLRRGLSTGFFRRAIDDRTVRAIYPNGFLPHIGSDIADGQGGLGAKGTFRGWGWDLSGVYGLSSFNFNVENSVNTSLGTTSPNSFDAGTLNHDQATFNVDVSRAFPALPVPLNVAFGTELRRDHYKIERGDPNSFAVGDVRILDGPNAGQFATPFAQVFPGFRPVDEVDEARTNVGVYLDVEATPFRQFLVTAAGRVENYSDFGSTTDGKLAARFEVIPGFALRGAMQTGFRAPSLGQSYFSAVSTNFVNINGVNTPFEVRTFPVSSQGGELLGARPLEPEQSINLSGGLTARPFANFSLSADYYDITIRDRIVLSGNFIHASVRQLLEENGILGVSGARYFTNAIDTRTQGLDIVANYGLDLGGAGVLRLVGGYNENRTKVFHVDPTPPQLAAVSTALFDRTQYTLIQRGQPRNSISLSLNHAAGNLTTNVHTQRYGKYTVYGTVASAPLDLTFRPNIDQHFGAKWITNASLSYRFFERVSLALGADNLFDVYPDTLITPNQTRGIYLYSGSSPFGFSGRFVYMRASFDLAYLASPLRGGKREAIGGRREEMVTPPARRRFDH